MGNENSLINFGDLSKPAIVLIKKISNAIGVLYEPKQIIRVANAKAEASKIEALSNIEVTEIQQRAIARLVQEEGRKQENIEKITATATKLLKEDSKPENIDDDWISNFFDKCRLVSDNEMQRLWSKILAGEANKPSSYSKRTVNLISELEKTDAQLFTNLLTFGWHIGDIVPLIYEEHHEIYKSKGINFNSLSHLDSLGLITFGHVSGYRRLGLPKEVTLSYYGESVSIKFNNDENNDLNIGLVRLTQAGTQLAPVCGSTSSKEFKEYVLNKWKGFKYEVS